MKRLFLGVRPERGVLLPLVAAAMLLAGCQSSRQTETQAKVDDLQKQLDQAKKELEQVKAKQDAGAVPVEGSPASPGQASPPVTALNGRPPVVTPSAPAPIVPKRPEVVEPARPSETARVVPPKVEPPPAPRVYTIAAGTPIVIRTTSTISSKTATDGERFEATLVEPLVDDGHIIAARGATVTGVVRRADQGGKVKGVASVDVQLQSVVARGGKPIALSTSTYSQFAKASKKKDATKVGIGSGIGAVIGAIAGGGKGAAIGAGVGAAGGTGVVLATRGEPAVIPAESVLRFSLRAPIRVESEQ